MIVDKKGLREVKNTPSFLCRSYKNVNFCLFTYLSICIPTYVSTYVCVSLSFIFV